MSSEPRSGRGKHARTMEEASGLFIQDRCSAELVILMPLRFYKLLRAENFLQWGLNHFTAIACSNRTSEETLASGMEWHISNKPILQMNTLNPKLQGN